MLKILSLFLVVLGNFLIAATPSVQSLRLTKTVSDRDDNSPLVRMGFTYNMEKYRLLKLASEKVQNNTGMADKKKSPVKAALFSGLVPGAGQYYAKSYWKSAIFAAIEIGAITAYVHYNNSGDAKDRQMRQLGDQRWSEQRYWSKVYMLATQGNKWDYGPLQVGADGVISDASYNQTTITRLRALETSSGFPGFTHELPHTKTQQYYEMIYKYEDQFGAGWIEVGTNWTYYDSYASLDHLLPDLAKYKKIRNESNDLYRIAFYASVSILANHLISAFEAAWSVKQENKRLSYGLTSSKVYYAGRYVPTLGMNISW